MVEHRRRRGSCVVHMGDVVRLGRAVDDDVEMLAAPRDHQIVEDAAVVAEQQRIAQPAVAQDREVGRQQRLQRPSRASRPATISWPIWLTSNSPARLARPAMLGDDAFILDRHLVAGERHHPRAARAVPGVERQRLFGASLITGLRSKASARGRPRQTPQTSDPLCHVNLRAFPRSLRRRRVTPSVARQPAAGERFPECPLRARSGVPERFRGGCSFGGAGEAPHALPRVRRRLCRPPRRGPSWASPSAQVEGVSASRCSAAAPGSAGSRPAARSWRVRTAARTAGSAMRVDRGVGIAGAALAGDLRGRSRAAGWRRRAAPTSWRCPRPARALAVGEVQRDAADPLGDDVGARPARRWRNRATSRRARRAGRAAAPARRSVTLVTIWSPVSSQVAAQIGDGRDDVDRARRRGCRPDRTG